MCDYICVWNMYTHTVICKGLRPDMIFKLFNAMMSDDII